MLKYSNHNSLFKTLKIKTFKIELKFTNYKLKLTFTLYLYHFYRQKANKKSCQSLYNDNFLFDNFTGEIFLCFIRKRYARAIFPLPVENNLGQYPLLQLILNPRKKTLVNQPRCHIL